MPRKNQGLPYLKSDRRGKWTYSRRIPKEYQQFFSGKASIRRTLPVNAANPQDPTLVAAWNEVHSQVEAQLLKAKQLLAQGSADHQAVTAKNAGQVRLNPRQLAAIGAHPLLRLLNEVDGEMSKTEAEESFSQSQLKH